MSELIVGKSLNQALHAAGIERPRLRPELDLSPLAFLPDDFWLRYGVFPRGVDLWPCEERLIVLPEGTKPFDLNPARLALP